MIQLAVSYERMKQYEFALKIYKKMYAKEE